MSGVRMAIIARNEGIDSRRRMAHRGVGTVPGVGATETATDAPARTGRASAFSPVQRPTQWIRNLVRRQRLSPSGAD